MCPCCARLVKSAGKWKLIVLTSKQYNGRGPLAAQSRAQLKYVYWHIRPSKAAKAGLNCSKEVKESQRFPKGKVILHPRPPGSCWPQHFWRTPATQDVKCSLGMNYGSWCENETGGNVFTGSGGSLFSVTSKEMYVQPNTRGLISAAHKPKGDLCNHAGT